MRLTLGGDSVAFTKHRSHPQRLKSSVKAVCLVETDSLLDATVMALS